MTIKLQPEKKVSLQAGVGKLQQAFEGALSQQRPALMPYFTLGYPQPASSLEIICALAEAGADLIELGLPFSDPLADGPTIQHSTQTALAQGVTPGRCLEMVAEIRSRGVSQPLILMGYFNPLLAYGVKRFVQDARTAGADGFIVPDLPPEEALELQSACAEHGLALVFLAAPNATEQRLQLVAQHSQGFLYLVSLTGVTGARQQLSDGLAEFIRRARQHSDLPLAVGFGISNARQARLVGAQAEGVIVGSALIRAAGAAADPVRASVDFLHELQAGIENCRMSDSADITKLSA